ncbi:fimbrial protein [Enterobacter asburiae]|uniref:fimbrial protein n=1 Tax=Enterobacter asburiae TaxID=61645 RepID=UPI002FFB3263
MKAIFKVTAVAALMAAGLSSAMAASGSGSAGVLVHGNVVPVACTMGPDASAPRDVNLGNWTESDFVSGASAPLSGLFFVPNSQQTFAITATGCSGTPPKENGEFLLNIDASTPMRNAASKILGDSSKANGTLAGFSLEAADKSVPNAPEQLWAAGDSLVLHKFTSGEGWNAVNNSSILFTTHMVATTATPGTGHVEAPVTFTVDYK